MEALARDDEGFIYALTSHSRNKKGQRSPDREHMLRFKIQNGEVLGLTSYDDLTQVLETDTKLHDLIRERTSAEVSFEEINIEGMAFDPVKKRLVLGFRDPEFNNMALVAFIANPKEVFEHNAKPEFDEVAVIDIAGGGIRSLNYDPILKTYIIANEVKDEAGERFSQLWTWSGKHSDEPQKITLPNLQHIKNVEAVDSITVNGKPRLIVMGDEGNASKKLTETFAKYLSSPFPQQPKPKHRFSAVFSPQSLLILPKRPLNPPRTPHNQASGPPFRRQQAHLACWPLSTGSNTSPSDGFAHSL